MFSRPGPTVLGHQLPSLWKALGLMAVFFSALDNLPYLWLWITNPEMGDYKIFYLAFQVGIKYGWPSMYNVPLFLDYQNHATHTQTLFLSLPLTAWLAGVFAWLPLHWAALSWEILIFLFMLFAWWIATTGMNRLLRGGLLLASLAFSPMLLSLSFGQTTILVGAALVVGSLLLQKGRGGWAGIAMSVVILKPQLGILIPITLWAAGQRRAAVFCVVATGVLGALDFGVLGFNGVGLWRQALTYTFDHNGSYLHFNTLTGSFGWVGGAFLSVAVLGLMILAAYRWREYPGMSAMIGVCASLMITIYFLPYDFAILMMIGMVLLRQRLPSWLLITLIIGFVVLDLRNLVLLFGLIWPVSLYWEMGFLALLALGPKPQKIKSQAV